VKIFDRVRSARATTVVPFDEGRREAADIALEHGLAMADAVLFATAARYRAEIVTADADFEGLPGVTLIR
jgi:predicted nucleic acid-binding protein